MRKRLAWAEYELEGVHALLDSLAIPRTTANPSGGEVTLTAAGRVARLAYVSGRVEYDGSLHEQVVESHTWDRPVVHDGRPVREKLLTTDDAKRVITEAYGVPDALVGIPTTRWQRLWQRMARR